MANWASVLGAALQQGTRTFAGLTAQENEERRLAEQQRLQQERFQQQAEMDRRRMEMDKQRFDADQQDREFRRLQAAIEDVMPNAEVSSDLFDRAVKAGLGNRFTVHQRQGDGSAPLGTVVAGLPALQDRITRNPNLQEQTVLTEQANTAADRAKRDKFREHLLTPEHQKESFDHQTAEAFAHGVNNIPMTGAEFDRRRAAEQQDALARIQATNQRYSGTFRNSADPKVQQWWTNYDRVSDNLRAAYSQQFRLLADNGDTDGIAELEAKIDAAARQRVGPMPGDATPPGDAPQDEAPTTPVDRIMKDFAGQIQADPQGFLQAIQNDPGVPPEAKAEIAKRIQAMGATRAAQGPVTHPHAVVGNTILNALKGVIGGVTQGGVHPRQPLVGDTPIDSILRILDQPAGKLNPPGSRVYRQSQNQ